MSAASTKETPHLHGTIRVSLPAKVAYNPDALKKTIGSLLGHLGCLTCFSGADCVFTSERNFVADQDGIFSHLTAVTPEPSPWFADRRVALAGGSQYDIAKVFSAVDAVIGTLDGCLYCHSGFDIAYLSEIGFLGIDPDGQAQQFGGAVGGFGNAER